tara:strand:+ start:766 stop:1041 length:276 start_codon:yes stop_codon:yes gene_type:complete
MVKKNYMKKITYILGLISFSISIIIGCSQYDDGEYQDLSNDVSKDSPKNLNKDEKLKIDEAIDNKENEIINVVLPKESGVTEFKDDDDWSE